MLLYFLLLLAIVPLTELFLLVEIGDAIGGLATIALVIFTGILGVGLARRQGWVTWQKMQAEISRGEVPADSMLDGLLILFAGALLIMPGILTDTLGFALLVPAVRGLFRRRMASHYKSRSTTHFYAQTQQNRPRRDDVIDVEFTRVPEERDKLPR